MYQDEETRLSNRGADREIDSTLFKFGMVMDRNAISINVGDTGISDIWNQVPSQLPTGLSPPLPISEPSLQLISLLSNEIATLLEEVGELRAELQTRPLSSSVLISTLNDSGTRGFF